MKLFDNIIDWLLNFGDRAYDDGWLLYFVGAVILLIVWYYWFN